MQEQIITHEEKVYIYTEEEKKAIIKRITDKYKGRLCYYWDYRDSLSNEQILKIIKEEDGLNDVYNELYDYNFSYIHEEINKVIEEELSSQEKTDNSLKEDLFQELSDIYNFNINDIIKNSSIDIRIELNTNEDFFYLLQYKKTEYYKLLRERFKGIITEKELKHEVINMMGSDYAKLTFFFKLKGKSILSFAEDYKKGIINLNKNVGCGLFNSWMGAGSVLEIKLKKPLSLNVHNWRVKGDSHNEYYNCSVLCDDISKYGIKEVYGFYDSAFIEN